MNFKRRARAKCDMQIGSSLTSVRSLARSLQCSQFGYQFQLGIFQTVRWSECELPSVSVSIFVSVLASACQRRSFEAVDWP